MAGLDHTGKAGAGGEFAQQATNWTAPAALDRSGQGELNKALVLDVKAWSTPRASDGKNGGPNHRGSKGDLMLPSMVAQWPTPAHRDGDPRRGATSPDSQAWANKVQRGAVNAAGMLSDDLKSSAAHWPTPISSDSRSQLGSAMPDRIAGRTASPTLSQLVTHSLSLPQAQPTPDGPPSSPSTQNSPRHLNPLFGAWLMGWPSTWVIAEPHASSALATALWRSRQQRRLSCLLSGRACSCSSPR